MDLYSDSFRLFFTCGCSPTVYHKNGFSSTPAPWPEADPEFVPIPKCVTLECWRPSARWIIHRPPCLSVHISEEGARAFCDQEVKIG